MKIKQIIFDFDGVILNSHIVKTNAFYYVFRKFGEPIAKAAKKHHLKNTGISRIRKFKFILKYNCKTKISKKLIKNLDIEFSKFCNKQILKLNTSNSLKYFLKKYKNKIKFHICSGSPDKDLKRTVKKINLMKYFSSINGSSQKKVTHIKKIRNNKLSTLFVGDSIEDYISSKKTNTLFVCKINKEKKNQFKNKNVERIYNFYQLEKYII